MLGAVGSEPAGAEPRRWDQGQLLPVAERPGRQIEAPRQLADAPLGVDAVRRWLGSEVTRLGKDLHELPWVAEPESE